jgi:hypothetical protein
MRGVAGDQFHEPVQVEPGFGFPRTSYLTSTSTVLRFLKARLNVYHRRSASPLSTLEGGSTKMLADFVSQTKNRYLQDVKDGKGGDWTVAMGNEAGGE